MFALFDTRRALFTTTPRLRRRRTPQFSLLARGLDTTPNRALTGQNLVRGVLTENQSRAVTVCWASRRSCGVANNLVLRKELAGAYLRSAMLPATTLAQRRGRLAPRTSSVAS